MSTHRAVTFPTILSIFYLLGVQPQPLHCSVQQARNTVAKIPAFQLSVPRRNSSKLPGNPKTGVKDVIVSCCHSSWRCHHKCMLSATGILKTGLAEWKYPYKRIMHKPTVNVTLSDYIFIYNLFLYEKVVRLDGGREKLHACACYLWEWDYNQCCMVLS